MKRYAAWGKVAGTALSVLLLLWLLSRQNWAALKAAVGGLSLLVMAGSWGLYAVGMAINAWRWHTLLRGVGLPVSWWKAVRLTFAGAFASNFLPSTIGGDALRVTGILDAAEADQALASVVVDRVLNVVAMYSFLPLTWKTYGALLPHLGRFGGGSPVWAAAFWGLPARVRGWLARFRQALALWAHTPRTLAAGLAIAWFSLLPVFTATWLLAGALGIPVAWYQVAGATVLSYTAALLPISLNGYGVREVTLVGLYTALGATSGQALTLAVVTRFLMMSVTFVGALWVGEAVPARHKVH